MTAAHQHVTGHCAVTYYPTVLLGRPVIVRVRAKPSRLKRRKVNRRARRS